jgi:hypothetical protein
MQLSTPSLFGLAFGIFVIGILLHFKVKKMPKPVTNQSRRRKGSKAFNYHPQNISIFLKKDVLEYILKSDDESSSSSEVFPPSRVRDEESFHTA